jgi:hypothetical protein
MLQYEIYIGQFLLPFTLISKMHMILPNSACFAFAVHGAGKGKSWLMCMDAYQRQLKSCYNLFLD